MYELVSELYGHRSDVRSLCAVPSPATTPSFLSGGKDNVVKHWISADAGKTFNAIKDFFGHEHWISSMLLLPGGKQFVTACNDHKLRVFSLESDEVTALSVGTGHTRPVVSLDFNPSTSQLASGSWDGSAKVWNFDRNTFTLTCVKTFGEQENGVSVLFLPNNILVAGSSGVNRNNVISDIYLRFFDLNKNGELIRTLGGPEGPIRSLCLHPSKQTFFCSSNDGSVTQYSLLGQVLQKFQNIFDLSGHSAFCYHVTVNKTGTTLSTANDDCFVRVWDINSGQLLQEVPHPATVWCSTFLDNGDIISAASDGVIRVFSTDASRQSLVETRQLYLKAVTETLNKQQSKMKGETVDPNKLVKIEFAQPGNRENEVKMFNKEGKAWAYQWSVESGSWIEIGEAIGQNDGGNEANMIDGVKYDRVLDIEFEDPRAGNSVKTLKIAFNNGDNPYVVANEFCMNNGLNTDLYANEVAKYIIKNRTEQKFTIGDNNDDISKSIAESLNKVSRKITTFPLGHKTGFVFDKLDNLDKIMTKIREFNGMIPETALEARLSASDLGSLESLCLVLSNASMYHSSLLPSAQVKVLCDALSSWELQHIFPLIDLMKLVLAHPEGAKTAGFIALKSVIMVILQNSTKALTELEESSANKKLKLQVVLTSLQLYANVFKTITGVEMYQKMVQNKTDFDSVLFPLKVISEPSIEAELDNKTLRLAFSTVVMNIANAFATDKVFTAELKSFLLSLLLGDLDDSAFIMKIIKQKEAESVRRSFIALGCCFLDPTPAGQEINEQSKFLRQQVLPAAKKEVQGLDKTCIDDLSEIL